ncbi:cytochrome P450 2C1-like isoform X2 [Paroedura picta]|uniref:cytochrome P450 2C1-like isoform X2 n=1 Tax=Paroedura picta TaxID=143630 RepID=UPI0040560A95
MGIPSRPRRPPRQPLKVYKKQSQLPPGPTPWLFLGNALQKDVLPLHSSYKKLMKKYGPVFTIWRGPKPVIVLCSYDVVKDALVDHSEEFGGRPPIPVTDQIFKRSEVSKTKDVKWKEHRRFILTTLRDFGMGKKTMSERVQAEAVCLVEEISAKQGKAFNPTRSIFAAVSNVICSVVFGTRFDYRDPVFQEHVHIIDNFMNFFHSPFAVMYNSFPKIMDLLPGPHKNLALDCEKIFASFRERVEAHKQTLDPQNPRDYIDCFLIKVEKEQHSAENVLKPEDIVGSVFSLFTAGTGTTSKALLYSLFLMAKLPHIQAKVQEEIDEVVGANRTPGMEDRLRLPFTNAVIHEVQRYENQTLENIPRAMTCHTAFRGFTIPQSTMVIPLIASVHFDPLQWETPEEFNPGHFLDEKGEFRKRDAFMPFSAGKRACPGEALARMELFLFFSVLLQNFTFRLATEDPEKDILSSYMKYKGGGVYPQMHAIKRSI